ncbi:hypothetical protein OG874_10800 [Nocardia sp. NBC_00565]|uniref:hypothetical protein n=1 Tax=Nocardia sp. NBC_00565 TaxID=2975993 RepID=UPI002E8071C4|nr:hypothetical protein [Nocardia sp. NBC_00565]WUC05594.1 hypothetical protein OG874_10800 [Nocardia sp. NBC_00565]
MVEVVQYAGGWLFDHILAGWDATVLVPDLVDTRPLQILGVGAVDRHTALSSSVRSPRPRAIAVAASLYAVDLRIRQELNGILDEGRTEVVLWGDKWPNSIDSGPEMTQHRLSAAAQAFKAQALTVAAGQVDTIGMVEKFGSAGAFALG